MGATSMWYITCTTARPHLYICEMLFVYHPSFLVNHPEKHRDHYTNIPGGKVSAGADDIYETTRNSCA